MHAIDRFLNLKIDKDQNLQEIVELASELCETPIALISLFDDDKHYFIFKVGMDAEQSARDETFCEYLTTDNELLIVEDALLDERFANKACVVSDPEVRFYAGVSLVTHDGHNLGSLCVLDTEPRQLSKAQKHLLKQLSKRIIQIMEFELSLDILKEQYLEAKDAETKLRSFFESGNSCHTLIGKELDIIAFNKNMAEFIERTYAIKIVAGMKVSEILSGPALERFTGECETALKGMPLRYEREVNYPNETIWWAITFDPGYNTQGEIIGISFNAYNITERILHEQQIIDQNNSLKSIAHIQSHELRRPVASILGFMEIFKSNGYQTNPDDVQLMEYATKELDERIRNIVSYTQ